MELLAFLLEFAGLGHEEIGLHEGVWGLEFRELPCENLQVVDGLVEDGQNLEGLGLVETQGLGLYLGDIGLELLNFLALFGGQRDDLVVRGERSGHIVSFLEALNFTLDFLPTSHGHSI